MLEFIDLDGNIHQIKARSDHALILKSISSTYVRLDTKGSGDFSPEEMDEAERIMSELDEKA